MRGYDGRTMHDAELRACIYLATALKEFKSGDLLVAVRLLEQVILDMRLLAALEAGGAA